MSFKEITLSGFLGRDARAGQMSDGRAVTNFSIAVNTRRNGEDKTEWYPVAAYGDLAEVAALLKKGSEVTIKASTFWPTVEEYQDSSGATQKDCIIKLIADRIYFHGRKPTDGE